MKLLGFSRQYAGAIEKLYDANPGLEHESFQRQEETLRHSKVPGTTNPLGDALRDHGYDVRTYPLDLKPMQRAWAREHGYSFGQDWRLEAAWAQVLDFSPDLLFIDPYAVPVAWLANLKRDCSSIRLVVSRYSSPRQSLERFKECDLVLSADQDQVTELRRLGIDAALLHHAFDVRVLADLDSSRAEIASWKHEVLFSGQVLLRSGFHLKRAEVLRHLVAAEVDIDLHISHSAQSRLGLAKQLAARFLWDMRVRVEPHRLISRLAHLPPLSVSRRWPERPALLDRSLRRKSQPPFYGVEMYEHILGAKVTLNVHGDISRNYANNLRLWEVTGVGGCLLTDAKQNLHELFEVDKEIVAFKHPKEAEEKARWLLQHGREREAIAKAGQVRTLRDHTYPIRAAQLDAIIRSRV